MLTLNVTVDFTINFSHNFGILGVSYVDGYIYPRTAMNPAQQIDAMLNCLNSAGAQFGNPN